MKPDFKSFDASQVDWDKSGGLVPAVAQHSHSLRVLMLGYVSKESLATTMETGLVTFFSRSKQRLWQKGETSGNVLRLQSLKLDCDNDTLLMLVDKEGPTCHLGTTSCFGDESAPNLSVLADLADTIHMRNLLPQHGSYTAKLFDEGLPRIAQKVGEEAVETVIAAITKSPTLANETADLLYHLLVLLEVSNIDLRDVLKILHDRAQPKKAA